MQSLTTWIAITAFAALAFTCIHGFIRSRRQHPTDELMVTTETMQSRADRKEEPNLGITTLSGRQSPTFSRSHLTEAESASQLRALTTAGLPASVSCTPSNFRAPAVQNSCTPPPAKALPVPVQ